jgi:hypothetical protein
MAASSSVKVNYVHCWRELRATKLLLVDSDLIQSAQHIADV